MRHALVQPGSFETADHYYPRVCNAQLHPLVRHFLTLGNERIATRYCHLHPESQPEAVRAALEFRARAFRWSGADLFVTTNEQGVRQVVVIETNSCPSGQKSFPLRHEEDELGGYRTLLEGAFLPMVARRRRLPRGELAVLYDKNPMETTGYAATLADVTGEPVHLVPCVDGAEPLHRFDDGVLHVRRGAGWVPIRAAFRYVTQRPWTRIPPLTRTAIFNPVLACLAGGRNKLVAAKAYDAMNLRMSETGLVVRVPETVRDVPLVEVPRWVELMGGVAVVKNPYSNAGQGVWTITNTDELDAMMALDHPYDRFIVQALIGNVGWSSRSRTGRLYHVGTVPNRKGQIHVADLRFMIGNGPDGFFPVAIYARRTRHPLVADLAGAKHTSWEMLGTNLSVKRTEGGWDTETNRLLLMDNRDFNKLGIGLDDLIEGYLQAVLATTAIDHQAASLVTQKGKFRQRYFATIDPDEALLAEVAQGIALGT